MPPSYKGFLKPATSLLMDRQPLRYSVPDAGIAGVANRIERVEMRMGTQGRLPCLMDE